MARAMWKGAIQFGLVTIPVKLYTATESGKTISFNMLHKEDLSRIQMKVFCPTDEEIIERRDTVRGYEYAPDQYVVITDEDLETVPLKTVRTIEIQQFVERESERLRPDAVRRAGLLRRAGSHRPQGVRAAQVGARGEGADGDRQGRDQGPRGPGGARSLRAHDAADDDQVAGRDPPGQRAGPAEGRAGVQARRAQDGGAARRGDDRRSSTPRTITTSTAKRCMKVIEAKVEGKETFTPPARPRSPRTSSTSWPRSRPAWPPRRSRATARQKPVSVAEARERASGASGAAASRPRPGSPRREATAVAADEEAEAPRKRGLRGAARAPEGRSHRDGGRPPAGTARCAHGRAGRTLTDAARAIQARSATFAKTPEPAGAPGTGGRGGRDAAGRPLRRPAPPGHPASLGLPPRDGRRPRQLGRAQGPVAGPGDPPDGRPRRGPPRRVLRLRGRDPGAPVRRRRRHRLGLGHLRTRIGDAGPGQGHRRRRAQVPASSARSSRAASPSSGPTAAAAAARARPRARARSGCSSTSATSTPSAGWDAGEFPQSVKTGRTNDDVKAERDAVWVSRAPAAQAEIDLSGAVERRRCRPSSSR